MASISGVDGKVSFTNGETYVKSWNLDYTAELYETTNFDDSSGGRSYITGFTGWSGSYDCNYSTANTAVPGSTGTIVLMSSTDSAGAWTGSVYITGMAINAPVDGLVTQTYNFQGSGALTANSTG